MNMFMIVNWQTFKSEAEKQVLIFTPGYETSGSYHHL